MYPRCAFTLRSCDVSSETNSSICPAGHNSPSDTHLLRACDCNYPYGPASHNPKMWRFLFHGHFLRHANFSTETSPEQSDSSAGVIGFELDNLRTFTTEINLQVCVLLTYRLFCLWQYYSSVDRNWSKLKTKIQVTCLKRANCNTTTKNGWSIMIKYSLLNL